MNAFGDRLSVVWANLTKDPIDSGVLRFPDANTKAFDVLGLEVSDDALHAIMGAAGTAWAETDLAWSNGHIIIDDKNIFDINFEVNLILGIVAIFISCIIVVEPQGFEPLGRYRAIS